MRPARRRLASTFAASVVLAVLVIAAVPVLRVVISHPVDVRAGEVAVSVGHVRIVALPFPAPYVSLHWRGSPDAHVSVALGTSPSAFDAPADVEADPGEGDNADTVFSDVIAADRATYARVTTDRPIQSLTVVAIDSGDRQAEPAAEPGVVDAAVAQPTIIPRSGWGANEAYRFDGFAKQRFAPGFFPLQKIIVHHTAGRNNDPNPAATIRAIYYDHAIIRGYGDIDYNFLIDAQGRIYEGRHARDYAPGEPVTGEDLAGNVVRGSHARDFNDGTVGIVLLGNFTSVQPTKAAHDALVQMLAWESERHGLDPKGSGLYVNPQLGNSKVLYNISGHRNVNSTACPGEAFYNTFPTLRQQVADYIASTTGASHDSTPPSASLKPMVPATTGALRMRFGLLFGEPITGLAAADFSVGGTSSGWTIDSITGKSADYEVDLVPPASPDEGTVTLTLKADAVTDLAAHTGPTADVTATVNYIHDSTAPTVVIYQTPHTSVSNAEFFDWTATFSEPVQGFDVPDVELGGAAASAWSIRRILGSGASYSFSTEQATPSDGTFTVQVKPGSITDLAGNPVAASNKITLVVDRSKPTTSAPSVRLASGTTLNGSAERALVTWSGSDVGPAGVASYDVARSINGGTFEMIASGQTGTSLPWSLTPGKTYRFEVRAHDAAGNISGWVAGATLKPAITDQDSSAVKWSGSSKTTSYSSYWGGTQRYLAATGASASYTTSARALSFITTRSGIRGTVLVYIDGALKATIDLSTGPTTYRWVAYTASWSTVGTHTIKVVSKGTPVPRVDVDAFGVIR